MSNGAFGESRALVAALAVRYGIDVDDVIKIAEELLGDLHRVSIQCDMGPMGAIYAARFLLSEEAQYHLAGILIEYLQFNNLEDTGEIITDLFRYVSPERDRWNEITAQWYKLKHPDRKILDESRLGDSGGTANE